MRKLSFDKRTHMFLAQQSGVAYEIAASRGHLSVTGRTLMSQTEKQARNRKRKAAKIARRKNRGA